MKKLSKADYNKMKASFKDQYGDEWERVFYAYLNKNDIEVAKEERGLWDNIHAKRKRGESPAKPGDKDYPDKKSWKKAQEARKLLSITKKLVIESKNEKLSRLYEELSSLVEGLNESPIITKMREIKDTHSAQKIKGKLVDAVTASMVVQLYDNVNDANKEKLNKMDLNTLIDITWKVIKPENVKFKSK